MVKGEFWVSERDTTCAEVDEGAICFLMMSAQGGQGWLALWTSEATSHVRVLGRISSPMWRIIEVMRF